jgi:hypothetical protein
MKSLWCWRCKMIIPMLNEQEFQKAQLLYSEGMKTKTTNREVRFKKLLDYYFEITGFQETEPNAIMHHRIDQYGLPCESCGKPYRTPKATFCAACGHKND